ncbi:aldo/keto reductase [Trametes versicolor FP-101664 SS1]|uniref:aldo/keto reductase n=1 Tax=Trametes versicolor (strain FP-101664) TaxID=717944 RepID=UPI00046236BD|nr:aldo/keto reductase [Trametes versicolor FP-101664 SS1]EIW62169.1 aldo/keto reductase [Trametes versicolor FP-101664 SS1]
MIKTANLGGTAKDIVVAKVAHGLMSMTRVDVVPDELAFEAIKSGIDALHPGVKMMLNSSEFYDINWGTTNLELLARFYEKYPEYADRTFLSVKASSPLYDLRRSVDKCIAALRGTKKIDLFQPARIDREVSVEDTMRTLVEMLHEGKFDHIGLSECRADTLRRGHAIYPVSVVEIEVSPMVYEEETKRVIATCAELDIALAAYSPLAHGMTAGIIKQREDFTGKLNRASHTSPHSPYHQNWDYTRRLIDAFTSLAPKKGCTPAQLSIAWVGSLGDKVIPLPSSTRKERTLENLYGADVELSPEDLADIARVMEENPLKGDRGYGDAIDLKLWG